MNTYKINHRAICPNTQTIDSYEITITAYSTIMVESINDAIHNAPMEIFQEALADYLSDELKANVRVEGWHQGVLVISERSNVQRLCRD
jgi:methionine synthase II (cobalamin-independent)